METSELNSKHCVNQLKAINQPNSVQSRTLFHIDGQAYKSCMRYLGRQLAYSNDRIGLACVFVADGLSSFQYEPEDYSAGIVSPCVL